MIIMRSQKGNRKKKGITCHMSIFFSNLIIAIMKRGYDNRLEIIAIALTIVIGENPKKTSNVHFKKPYKVNHPIKKFITFQLNSIP